MKPLDLTKFEPGRPVYVLMHKDKTHLHCLPNGEVDWDYSKARMDLVEQILTKEFNNPNYISIELSVAWPHICNHQAELVTLWTPTINAIRKAKTLKARFELYQSFRQKTKTAHPLEADALLKRLLQL